MRLLAIATTLALSKVVLAAPVTTVEAGLACDTKKAFWDYAKLTPSVEGQRLLDWASGHHCITIPKGTHVEVVTLGVVTMTFTIVAPAPASIREEIKHWNPVLYGENTVHPFVLPKDFYEK